MVNVTPIQQVRFWSKVTESGSCWQWSAARDPAGYGCVTINKEPHKAHRISYEITRGPIPPGAMLDHSCHNRSCVNPEHLRVVTTKQNGEHRSKSNSNSKSGVRGVFWYPNYRRWVARVRHNGRLIHVGYFDTVAEAERAVMAKRNELFTHNDADRTATA